jgi:hypothetical protein
MALRKSMEEMANTAGMIVPGTIVPILLEPSGFSLKFDPTYTGRAWARPEYQRNPPVLSEDDESIETEYL